LTGLRYLAARGIVCKVNTVMLKGINDHHIEDVVIKIKEIGVYISNIMQLIPVEGSPFEQLELVSNKEIMALRKKCEPELRQMYHCKQCRADAVGTLDNDQSIEYSGACKPALPPRKNKAKKYAVASKSGMLVDQHFGHAGEFYIYESNGKTVKFIEKRLVKNYCNGKAECGVKADHFGQDDSVGPNNKSGPDVSADDKNPAMDSILAAVSDCTCVLALRCGDAPMRKLESLGIDVISTYDRIEDAVLKTAATQLKKEIC